MVPAAHRLKSGYKSGHSSLYWVLQVPCLRYWGLPRIPRKSFVFHWPLASHGGSHRFESYSAHQINNLATLSQNLAPLTVINERRNAQAFYAKALFGYFSRVSITCDYRKLRFRCLGFSCSVGVRNFGGRRPDGIVLATSVQRLTGVGS